MLCELCFSYFFLYKQKSAYEMRISAWSSDVCSSDLALAQPGQGGAHHPLVRGQHPRDRAVPDRLILLAVERAEARYAGIVDEDVDAAELRGDLADDARDRRGVGHVERKEIGRAHV